MIPTENTDTNKPENLNTDVNKNSPIENTLQVEVENLNAGEIKPVEVVSEVKTEGETTSIPVINLNVDENRGKTDTDDDIPERKRWQLTCTLNKEESAYVEPIVNDLIKFGVVKDNNDFLRKAIDLYINYQTVCTEVGVKNILYPIPDGKDGSMLITHRLLKNSLFLDISKLPVCK